MLDRKVYIPTAELLYLIGEIQRARLQFVPPIHIDGHTYTVHLEDRANLRDYGTFSGDIRAMLRVIQEFHTDARRAR